MAKKPINDWHCLRQTVLKSIAEMRADARAKYEACQNVDFNTLRAMLKITELGGFDVIHANAYVPYYGDRTKGTVELAVHIRALDGLKTPKLVGLIGYLDGRFGAKNSRDSLGEYHAERVYEFGNSECPIEISLHVDLDGAAKCRRIKTATDKVQTVVEFTLVCDD